MKVLIAALLTGLLFCGCGEGADDKDKDDNENPDNTPGDPDEC